MKRKSRQYGRPAPAVRKSRLTCVPQVLPASLEFQCFAGTSTSRKSTVLGPVGAGGIGVELDASITKLYWTQVSFMLLVIVGNVILSEWVSAKVRHAII